MRVQESAIEDKPDADEGRHNAEDEDDDDEEERELHPRSPVPNLLRLLMEVVWEVKGITE